MRRRRRCCAPISSAGSGSPACSSRAWAPTRPTKSCSGSRRTTRRSGSTASPLLGPGGVARGGAAQDLEGQEGALAPGRRDVDPELLDCPVGGQPAQLVDVHADQLLARDRRRGLGDRTALAVEADVGDLAVLDLDVHAELVAAEGVVVVELEVVRIEGPEVPGVLVVLEDVVAVKSIHG